MSPTQGATEPSPRSGYPRQGHREEVGYRPHQQQPYGTVHPAAQRQGDVISPSLPAGYQQPSPSEGVTPDSWPNNNPSGLHLPLQGQGAPLSFSHNSRTKHYPSSPYDYSSYYPLPLSSGAYIPASAPLPPGENPVTSLSSAIYQSNGPLTSATIATTKTTPTPFQTNTTLWWSDLEPWMDHQYVESVCRMMGWSPVDIKMPSPHVEVTNGRAIPNNAGYCLLAFQDSAQAQAALSQVSDKPTMMPNSRRPFALSLAANVPSATFAAAVTQHNYETKRVSYAYNSPQPPEWSIFVGDLAPETSNSDLIDVFRDPVLGLRNDRAPKYIRPFTSVKSAKIILDPLTGVSKGYGFVRFSEEADMQRALIEMHGLYCLSRPMRVSPATAKNKNGNAAQAQLSYGLPYPSASGMASPIAQVTSRTASIASHLMAPNTAQGLGASSEARGHRNTAGAILSHMLGPNGEQLTSLDPYNTTVFVGGLSPLVGEDTLRTFFEPFGDIHYVKVPAGKHCGFVQFVRKVDAQEAIEKMQGHSIAGSRIRLSWGRSQYKAAQAAAQAAQAAEIRALLESHAAQAAAPGMNYGFQPHISHDSSPTVVPVATRSLPNDVNQMTPGQAAQLVDSLVQSGNMSEEERMAVRILTGIGSGAPPSPPLSHGSGAGRGTGSLSDGGYPSRTPSTFSPFSPTLDVSGEIMRHPTSQAVPRGYNAGSQPTFAPSSYPGESVWRLSSDTSPASRHASLSRLSPNGTKRLPQDEASMQDLNGTLKSLNLDGNSSSSLHGQLASRV